MKMKPIRTLLCGALILAGLTAVGTMAAGGAGSKSDPLVTLSYLNETFTGQMMNQVDAAIRDRNAKLTHGGTDEAVLYTAIELAKGKTLRGEAGCEILLRTGTAKCTNQSASGLVDATTGEVMAGEDGLQPNHLYLLTDSEEVVIDEDAVFLVRGAYAVG